MGKINREDMLELTRRMTLKRNCFDRIAGAYLDEEEFGQRYRTDKSYAIYFFHGSYDVPLKASDKEILNLNNRKLKGKENGINIQRSCQIGCRFADGHL